MLKPLWHDCFVLLDEEFITFKRFYDHKTTIEMVKVHKQKDYTQLNTY